MKAVCIVSSDCLFSDLPPHRAWKKEHSAPRKGKFAILYAKIYLHALPTSRCLEADGRSRGGAVVSEIACPLTLHMTSALQLNGVLTPLLTIHQP